MYGRRYMAVFVVRGESFPILFGSKMLFSMPNNHVIEAPFTFGWYAREESNANNQKIIHIF